MFFNVGGAEILVIAMVALIAVGPEQLPGVLRKIGGFVAQARSMTAGLRDEFMSGLDEVSDAANPKTWMGSGSDDDPVVPRGYANKQRAQASANGDADEVDDDDGDEVDIDDGDIDEVDVGEAQGALSNGDEPTTTQVDDDEAADDDSDEPVSDCDEPTAGAEDPLSGAEDPA